MDDVPLLLASLRAADEATVIAHVAHMAVALRDPVNHLDPFHRLAARLAVHLIISKEYPLNNLSAVAPYVLSVSGAAFVTAVIVQILKPLLKVKGLKDNPNQDAFVRASVYVVALGVVLTSQFLHYSLNTRTDVSTALGAAFAVAAMAIGLYHVLDSTTIPTIPLGTFTSLTPIHGEEPVPANEVAVGTSEPATPPAAV